ncbi:hypothetical protein ABTH71_20265, partial [Acinetobacter baumannii]
SLGELSYFVCEGGRIPGGHPWCGARHAASLSSSMVISIATAASRRQVARSDKARTSAALAPADR